VEGSYKFEKGENMEAFFKAAGYGDDSLLDSMKNYRLHYYPTRQASTSKINRKYIYFTRAPYSS
jgi:hypothetical protein